MHRPAPTAALAALREILGDRLDTSPASLDLHGRDESPFEPRRPDAVAFVRSTDEVAAVLRTCSEHRLPVVPFGAGSSVDGHVLPTRGGLSLDLTRMDRILGISVDDLLVRVEAGVQRVALGERLRREGLLFGVDPGADATLGGMAATGASGTLALRYGSMRENVLGLTVVLADGRIVRTGAATRKSSAGYDLTRLIVGSEGTLAVITELTLKLHGIPERVAAAACSFPTLADGVAAAVAIVGSGIPLARCEFLDATAIRAVNARFGSDAPERPTLFFEFHGSPVSVADDAAAAEAIAPLHRGSDFRWSLDQADRNKLWLARHEALFASLALRPGCRALSTDVCVPRSRLAECVAAAEALLADAPFPFVIIGHLGDGNFHCILLVDPDAPSEMAGAERAAERLTEIALELDGTSSGEHGIGLGKRTALVREAGPEGVAVMRAIKRALDPLGILNPDKIFEAAEDPAIRAAGPTLAAHRP
jgi:D-lactate dehydrogenase (cytochrome)